jgi:hypothetical protein
VLVADLSIARFGESRAIDQGSAKAGRRFRLARRRRHQIDAMIFPVPAIAATAALAARLSLNDGVICALPLTIAVAALARLPVRRVAGRPISPSQLPLPGHGEG